MGTAVIEAAAAALAAQRAEEARARSDAATLAANIAAAQANESVLHAVAEVHNLADRLGHAAADRSHDLAAVVPARDVSQAANRQITQAIADRALAAKPSQAFSVSLAPTTKCLGAPSAPSATVEDPPAATAAAAAVAAAPMPRAPVPLGPLTNSH